MVKYVKVDESLCDKSRRFPDFFGHFESVVPVFIDRLKTVGWDYTDGHIIRSATSMRADIAYDFAMWILSACSRMGVVMGDTATLDNKLTHGQRSACSDMQKRIDRQNAEIDRLKEKLREARSERDIQVEQGDPDAECRDCDALIEEREADEVESLARVLCAAYCAVNKYGKEWESQSSAGMDHYMAEARAAIAHMRKRPEGLPTADQFNAHFASIDRGLFEHEVIELIYDYLAPYLRDPAGKPELDITVDEIVKLIVHDHRDTIKIAQAVLDLCRSRIRPTFECKECAKKQKDIDLTTKALEMINQQIRSAMETQ